MDMKTETVLNALEILAAQPDGCDLRTFAREMWPRSRKWRKPSKRPKDGEAAGAVMNTAAGGMLGKLRRENLVERVGAGYRITRAGLEYLGRRGRPVEAPGPTQPPGVVARAPMPMLTAPMPMAAAVPPPAPQPLPFAPPPPLPQPPAPPSWTVPAPVPQQAPSPAPLVGVAPPPAPQPPPIAPPVVLPLPPPQRLGTAPNGAQVPLMWDGMQWVYWDFGTQRPEPWPWG